MIQIKKTGRREVHVIFDAVGANDLRSALGGEQAVAILADERILKRETTRADELRGATFSVAIDAALDALLVDVESNHLTLSLDAASAEAIAARLGGVESVGFFPAEMVEVELGGPGGERVTLYGEMTYDVTETIVRVLDSRSQATLRDIYTCADPRESARFGIRSVTQEWDRWRKYAYSRYWQNRLNDGSVISDEELEELQLQLDVELMHRVTSGILGDAARRNLIAPVALLRLQSSSSLTSYGARQIRARLALLGLDCNADLIDLLLDLRAAWALHELLGGDLTHDQFSLVESATGDRRLSRVERHRLREALRARGWRS